MEFALFAKKHTLSGYCAQQQTLLRLEANRRTRPHIPLIVVLAFVSFYRSPLPSKNRITTLQFQNTLLEKERFFLCHPIGID